MPTKVYIVKAMMFPLVMYDCESWTIKKAKSWRIGAFELWCWKKTLESPLDSKEIKPVNPKENQPWMSIGRTDLKSKLQYFGHLMWRANSLEKTLMLENTEGKRRRGQQRVRWLDSLSNHWVHHWLNGHELEQTVGDGGGQESLAYCSPWGHKELDTS